MNRIVQHLLFLLSSSIHLLSATTAAAYPTTNDSESCGLSSSQPTEERDLCGHGRIINISHRFHPNMLAFDSSGSDVVGQFLWLTQSMKNGSIVNISLLKLPFQAGTHVDAPGHVFGHYFDAGFDVHTLVLDVLNGPALLVDVPRDR